MKVDPFDQVKSFLPIRLQNVLCNLEKEKRAKAEEIRLRVGQPLRIVVDANEYCPDSEFSVRPDDLYTALEMASEHSVHTALEQIRGGFVTVRGGHRIGICGEAITESGRVMGFRRPSSLNIRIAREIKGAANQIVEQITDGDRLKNTLIIAPPGAGKTTVLRDLIRRLSSGDRIKSQRVGVIDERGELAALWNGVPQMDLGAQTDVLDGVPKAEGILFLLRGMSPQIIAVDEITHPDDIYAITLAAGGGASILATIHGDNQQNLLMRPVCRELLKQKIFQCAVLLGSESNGNRRWKVEEMLC